MKMCTFSEYNDCGHQENNNNFVEITSISAFCIKTKPIFIITFIQNEKQNQLNDFNSNYT